MTALDSLPPGDRADVIEGMRTAVAFGRAMQRDPDGALDLLMQLTRPELNTTAMALAGLLNDALTDRGLGWDAISVAIEQRLGHS